MQLTEEFILVHEVGLGEDGVGEVGVLSEVEGKGESLTVLQLAVTDVLQVAKGFLVVLEDAGGNEGVVLEDLEPELGNSLDF